ncbi:MAG TPA: ABC transporter permease [Ktedonobacterales bacterium]|jgi:ABC-2 type transport system permease protein|nr:ABC transporter permease [Ktedonobacterales bacterium]
MIGDIGTVMWKEWREYFAGPSASGGSGRGRGVIGVLLIMGIISILLPLLLGRALITSGTPVIVDGVYLPAMILLNVIPDSFAGERERHTLETLLASRLSDRAILFGKVGAAVTYGWAVGLSAALVQVVVANLSHKNARPGAALAFYPAGSAIAIVVLGLLMSLLIASVGCLVSLRASTTRQAQLNLSFGFLVLVFAPVILLQLLPRETQSNFLALLNTANPTQVFFIIVGALLVVDVALLFIALARFQRARLILA